MRSEPGEDQAPTKFSISEVQGDRSARKSSLLSVFSLFIALCMCIWFICTRTSVAYSSHAIG